MTWEEERQQIERLKPIAAKMLADHFNGNIAAASRKLGMTKDAIHLFLHGHRPKLEHVEWIANGLNEPVNKWRSICGYSQIVEEEWTPKEGE